MQQTTLSRLTDTNPKAKVSKYQKNLVDLHLRANGEVFLFIKGNRVRIIDSNEITRIVPERWWKK